MINQIGLYNSVISEFKYPNSTLMLRSHDAMMQICMDMVIDGYLYRHRDFGSGMRMLVFMLDMKGMTIKHLYFNYQDMFDETVRY